MFNNLVTSSIAERISNGAYVAIGTDRQSIAQGISDYDAYYNETGFADIDEAEHMYSRACLKEPNETDYPDYF